MEVGTGGRSRDGNGDGTGDRNESTVGDENGDEDRNGDESGDGNESNSGDGNGDEDGNGNKDSIGKGGREANKRKNQHKTCRRNVGNGEDLRGRKKKHTSTKKRLVQ